TARYGLADTGEGWKDNYDTISEGENPSWYLGLDLSLFPLNKRGKSELKEINFEIEKAQAEVEDKKLAIINECRSLTRKVNTQALYVRAASRSLQLQKKKLDLEEAKFDQGRSSIQWLLTYQNDLSSAEIEYFRALTDYYKVMSDLKLITGK
ncbi:TolC family protein, partial [Elusimicrobiota bacterium]